MTVKLSGSTAKVRIQVKIIATGAGQVYTTVLAPDRSCIGGGTIDGDSGGICFVAIGVCNHMLHNNKIFIMHAC